MALPRPHGNRDPTGAAGTRTARRALKAKFPVTMLGEDK